MSNRAKVIPVAEPTNDRTSEPLPGHYLDESVNETAIIQPVAVILNLPHDQSFYANVAYLANIVKWMAVLDSVICVLFILGGVYWALFIIALPIFGYCSAKNYHPNLAVCYLLYLLLVIVLRIALAISIDDEAYRVSQTLIILLQFVIIVYDVRFIVILYKLSEQERFVLAKAANEDSEPSPSE